jgi:hypothetical protein
VVFGPQTFLSIRVTVHVLRENLILVLNITRNNKIEIQVDRHCKFRGFSYIKEILVHTLYNMINQCSNISARGINVQWNEHWNTRKAFSSSSLQKKVQRINLSTKNKPNALVSL